MAISLTHGLLAGIPNKTLYAGAQIGPFGELGIFHSPQRAIKKAAGVDSEFVN